MIPASIDLPLAAALIAAGFVAGVMNSIAGGGTLVTFPTLLFAGLPSVVANATSTVALLPAALSSAAGYWSKLPTVARWLRLFAPVSLAGGLTGGILLVQTPSRVFDWLVPFLILFATVLFMANSLFARLSGNRATPGSSASSSWTAGAVVFQFGVAAYGGYFGAGIGILMLASLGMLGFDDVHEMNALKVILGFLINVVAALYFVWSGLIHWSAAGAMTLGTILGGYAGAHVAQKIPQARVRAMITAIGLIISAVMFYRQFA
ncbi:MAG: sulfite exporter TauE/SafE family protein [Bacteroidota bacterium]